MLGTVHCILFKVRIVVNGVELYFLEQKGDSPDERLKNTGQEGH